MGDYCYVAVKWEDALRIGLIAPPLLPVPPPRYGGTERIVHVLAEGLHARGHDVTLFASGDSRVSCPLVQTVDRATWSGGADDLESGMAQVAAAVQSRATSFDLLHSHLDTFGFELALDAGVPMLSTMHGRLDEPPTQAMLSAHPDLPLVAISHHQRASAPSATWLGVVHHGLDLASAPFGRTAGDYLLFVGRVNRLKGTVAAIELAQRVGQRLLIVAKVRDDEEAELFEQVVRPALRPGRIDFLGELAATARDRLFAGALATLMLGDWPEPFGLVAIESLATGTPVIATRHGALPEIVEHGRDGFIVDEPHDADRAVRLAALLDRQAIRRRAIRRFSVQRMVDEYLVLYRRLLGRRERSATSDEPEIEITRPAVGRAGRVPG